MLRIIAVFHEKKAGNVIELNPAIAANPTLSIDGMQNTQDKLLPKIKELGPFAGIFTSRMARALDTASVLALALDLDIMTVKGLGQAANLDRNTQGETVVVAYPGFEEDSYGEWLQGAIEALDDINDEMCGSGNILIVSHRPVIGAMVAYAEGITSPTDIEAIVNDPATVGEGYRVFDYDDGELILVK